MAFMIAGLVAEQAVIVKNCQNVATSFPNFIHLLQNVMMPIEEQPDA